MALTDILFYDGERQEFLVEIGPGTLGTPNDILFDSLTMAGRHILEIGPSYADPEALAAIIWTYENRTLTD